MRKIGTIILVLSVLSIPLMTEAFLHRREALVDASTLLGSPVRDIEGKDMGKLEQLMIKPENGQIAYAIVALGGTLGFGEKLVAVPWDALKVKQDKKTLVLTVERKVLEKASRMEKGNRVDKGGEAEPEKEKK